MCLINIVIVYLYGSIDKNIHMKILEGFKMPEVFMINLGVFILLHYKNLYMSWSNLVESGIIILMNTS